MRRLQRSARRWLGASSKIMHLSMEQAGRLRLDDDILRGERPSPAMRGRGTDRHGLARCGRGSYRRRLDRLGNAKYATIYFVSQRSAAIDDYGNRNADLQLLPQSLYGRICRVLLAGPPDGCGKGLSRRDRVQRLHDGDGLLPIGVVNLFSPPDFGKKTCEIPCGFRVGNADDCHGATIPPPEPPSAATPAMPPTPARTGFCAVPSCPGYACAGRLRAAAAGRR
jgi:hypothetical protein